MKNVVIITTVLGVLGFVGCNKPATVQAEPTNNPPVQPEKPATAQAAPTETKTAVQQPTTPPSKQPSPLSLEDAKKLIVGIWKAENFKILSFDSEGRISLEIMIPNGNTLIVGDTLKGKVFYRLSQDENSKRLKLFRTEGARQEELYFEIITIEEKKLEVRFYSDGKPVVSTTQFELIEKEPQKIKEK